MGMLLSFCSVAKVFLSAVLIGAANLIPGLSGATMAVITNQYHSLIQQCSLVATGKVRFIDYGYLVVMASGIGAGIVVLSIPLHHAISNYPFYTLMTINGLVMGSLSAIRIANQSRSFRHKCMQPFFLVGVIGLGSISLFDQSGHVLSISDGGFFQFICGVIAMAAMIIPGISGSMILVILGAYEPMLLAIKTVDIMKLLPFISGVFFGGIIGILGIRRLLLMWPNQFESFIFGLIYSSILVVFLQAFSSEGGGNFWVGSIVCIGACIGSNRWVNHVKR